MFQRAYRSEAEHEHGKCAEQRAGRDFDLADLEARTGLGKARDELDPRLIERGEAALARIDLGLKGSPYLAGGGVTLADVALVAYTRWAHEGGFDLGTYPHVRAWIARLERELAISD